MLDDDKAVVIQGVRHQDCFPIQRVPLLDNLKLVRARIKLDHIHGNRPRLPGVQDEFFFFEKPGDRLWGGFSQTERGRGAVVAFSPHIRLETLWLGRALVEAVLPTPHDRLTFEDFPPSVEEDDGVELPQDLVVLAKCRSEVTIPV